MLFSFNEKSVTLLVFFVHALIFAGLLLVKGIRQSNRPDRWLSLFMLLSALYIAPFMLGYAGWYSGGIYREVLFYIPFQQLFLIPPVLYFYIRSLLDSSFRIRGRDYLHFLPAVLYGLYTLLMFVWDQLLAGDPAFYANGMDKDFSTWYQVAGFAWMIFYLLASFDAYRKYRHYVLASLSFADAVLYKWVERFMVAFLVLLGLRLVFFIVNPEWGAFGRKFWYYVCFSILIYYVSLHGLVSSFRLAVPLHLFSGAPERSNRPAFPAPAIKKDDEATQTAGPAAGIDAGELSVWTERIGEIMDREKLFENPLLTIAELAERLAIHPKKVSQFINQGFGMNYNDFVNSYRVKAVVAKMERGETDLQTIIGLAFDAGFNSKSTFNRVFKKTTGVTPREYLARVQQK